MKKSRFVFPLVLLLLFLLPTASLAAVTASPQSVYVDGVKVAFEAYNIDGSNYFKLRDIAYALNNTASQFSVSYDPAGKLISLTQGEAYTPVGGELQAGADQSATARKSRESLRVNGQTADLMAYNIGGNNFFQLRALGQALGFGVSYDPAFNSVLIQSGAGQSLGQKLTAEQIYDRCAPAVFFVETYDALGNSLGTGSGFFIDSSGTALTNYHVLEGASSAKIALANSEQFYNIAGIYDYSLDYDLALIKIEGSGFAFLETGDSGNIRGGAKVYTIGSPIGLINTIAEGIISNPARILDQIPYLQFSAPISHGSSGGALINEYGQVVGVTTAIFEGGQNLNIAVPIHYAAALSQAGSYRQLSTALPQTAPADAYTVLAAYLRQYGDYDASGGFYYVESTDSYNDFYIFYFPSGDILLLNNFYSDYGVVNSYITIEGISAAYPFDLYMEDYEVQGHGSLRANTFSSASSLTFAEYEGPADNRKDYCDIAKYMLLDSLYATEYLLQSLGIGVSIQDFGFTAAYQEFYY